MEKRSKSRKKSKKKPLKTERFSKKRKREFEERERKIRKVTKSGISVGIPVKNETGFTFSGRLKINNDSLFQKKLSKNRDSLFEVSLQGKWENKVPQGFFVHYLTKWDDDNEKMEVTPKYISFHGGKGKVIKEQKIIVNEKKERKFEKMKISDFDFRIKHNNELGEGNLKVLEAECGGVTFAVKEFQKEEEAKKETNICLRALNPRVVTVFGYAEVKKKFYVLMEKMDCNITEFFSKKENNAKCFDIFLKMAKCLKSLHDKGIVHRDVKETNFLINKNTEVVKICDFGISKELKTDLKTQTTSKRCGTWIYIAPEVLKNKKFNIYSDVYSLGITFNRIFEGIEFDNKKVSKIFQKMIKKMLQEKPKSRYKIVEVVSELKKLLIHNRRD